MDASLFSHLFAAPSSITTLLLDPDARSIRVKWEKPEGCYQNFSLTLSTPGTEDRIDITGSTNLTYTDLKAGAKYTVKIKVIGFQGRESSATENSTYTCKFNANNCAYLDTFYFTDINSVSSSSSF